MIRNPRETSMKPLSDRTRLIASATRRGRGRRPVNPPIERASTMLSDTVEAMRDPSDGPVYGLDGTSAARELRLALADLERASVPQADTIEAAARRLTRREV